jgi:hypothetical protein
VNNWYVMWSESWADDWIRAVKAAREAIVRFEVLRS